MNDPIGEAVARLKAAQKQTEKAGKKTADQIKSTQDAHARVHRDVIRPTLQSIVERVKKENYEAVIGGGDYGTTLTVNTGEHFQRAACLHFVSPRGSTARIISVTRDYGIGSDDHVNERVTSLDLDTTGQAAVKQLGEQFVAFIFDYTVARTVPKKT